LLSPEYKKVNTGIFLILQVTDIILMSVNSCKNYSDQITPWRGVNYILTHVEVK
jgi:hypothetical protein